MSSDSYQISKSAGEVIFREGDPADCAYVIEQGHVQVTVNRDDEQVVLSDLGAGEILGEMAVIDQYSRTATATVTEDSVLILVTPEQIRQRIDDSDAVVRSLLDILLTRYRAELTLEQGLPMEAESVFLKQSGGIEKIRFENELRRGLDNGGINVVYQPIQCLRSGTTNGLEALVRWDHPTQGTIPPEQLITLAEETDLIVPLSLYVFRAAVADFAEFRAVAQRELFASVNVSPKHTVDSEFLNRAWDICTQAGGRPDEIMLELTESVMVDIQQLTSWVRTAKAMGFRISVDDFGTGYASLEYLTRLEPHTVKIDQDFIRPLTSDPRHAAVMRKVIEMARELDVLVIAEGVEAPEHVRVLADMGCDMAQGYAVGRPLARSRAVEFLAPAPAGGRSRG